MKNATRQWPPEHAEVFESNGLRCALVLMDANPFMRAYFCGYVRVPPDHPWAGKHYDDIDVAVHGGLTFSCDDADGGTWIGWDDAHLNSCEQSPLDETIALAGQVAAAGRLAS